MRIITLDFAFMGGDLSKEAIMPVMESTFAKIIKAKIPSVNGTPTATLAIFDGKNVDEQIYEKTGIPEGAVTVISDIALGTVPLSVGMKVVLTFTTAPGRSESSVTFYLE